MGYQIPLRYFSGESNTEGTMNKLLILAAIPRSFMINIRLFGWGV